MQDIPDKLYIKKILDRDLGAGARLIRMIEEDDPKASGLLKALYPHSGNAFIIGITGSPGTGKSTIIDGLITQFRINEFKVGVIAVDPTSPFSGGAILGDRLRMQGHATDENVFIRSMASRGEKGGLSKATKDAAIVLDAMGYEIIIIETVGAGQGEFEISFIAHSIGIVAAPGTCDGIQAVKAGILETGDIFIVNKGDLPGADVSVDQLSMVMEMKSSKSKWKPRVLKTIAREGQGLAKLADTFLVHYKFLEKNNLMEEKRKEQERLYFTCLLKNLFISKLLLNVENTRDYKEVLNKLGSREINPITAAEQVVEKMLNTVV
ncbi:MAG: methylmalonyl Co-A mutase-associated GTPase MeaB [Desulfobacteraceae bacterium]|nr:methylmalonyl Co-A mutase-associated GTPase MeaB [Desulfobacteraceae bacterium]